MLPTTRYSTGTVWLCGLIHMLVDAASITLYFTLFRHEAFGPPPTLFLLYGILAFALQAPLGIFADRIRRPVGTAIIGCLLVAAGPFFLDVPGLALSMVCLGNALYHVGGGIITLSLSGGRAALPGIYVAPGTLGVVIGSALGGMEIQPTGIFALSFGFAVVGLWIFARPFARTTTSFRVFDSETPTPTPTPFFVAILFLCGVVVLRSLVGQISSPLLKDFMPWIYAVPAAVFAGKLLGGFLADRFGWHGFVLTALLLSAPLTLCVEFCPWAALLGVFLFTMTMPVTLAAISNLLPGYPGFAFGLTGLSVVIGAFGAMHVPKETFAVLVGILLAALLFHFGVRVYNGLVRKSSL